MTPDIQARCKHTFKKILSVIVVVLAGCSETATIPISANSGPHPTLPKPVHQLVPTLNIAPAVGWPLNSKPRAAEGTQVNAFATGLDHPRWIYVLPNGDTLVAETNAPPKPDDGKGIKGWVMGLVMKKAGSATPSANRITLLRDTNADGIADARFTFIDKLNSPFGMALIDDRLYIANTDAVLEFPYSIGETQIKVAGKKLLDLPAGPINHHWTKNLLASPDGQKLYISVGSNSNVAERGMAAEIGRAAIWEFDLKTHTQRIFASGLRNPNGMAWEPETGKLWTVVNERDELGSDLVPDYLTSLRDGGFYGWPYSYFGHQPDARVKPARPDLIATAVVPDYALGSHTAPLGLAYSAGNSLPPGFAKGMFIGQHGSWNRRPYSGYKVIFVPFAHGVAAGPAEDVLTAFLSEQDTAYGRPVGVALDKSGSLLVADDVGNCIWRVSSL
jgi:glucose/arabinose dehydrogenase